MIPEEGGSIIHLLRIAIDLKKGLKRSLRTFIGC